MEDDEMKRQMALFRFNPDVSTIFSCCEHPGFRTVSPIQVVGAALVSSGRNSGFVVVTLNDVDFIVRARQRCILFPVWL